MQSFLSRQMTCGPVIHLSRFWVKRSILLMSASWTVHISKLNTTHWWANSLPPKGSTGVVGSKYRQCAGHGIDMPPGLNSTTLTVRRKKKIGPQLLLSWTACLQHTLKHLGQWHLQHKVLKLRSQQRKKRTLALQSISCLNYRHIFSPDFKEAIKGEPTSKRWIPANNGNVMRETFCRLATWQRGICLSQQPVHHQRECSSQVAILSYTNRLL